MEGAASGEVPCSIGLISSGQLGTDGVIPVAERLLFEHNIIGLEHPMCESWDWSFFEKIVLEIYSGTQLVVAQEQQPWGTFSVVLFLKEPFWLPEKWTRLKGKKPVEAFVQWEVIGWPWATEKCGICGVWEVGSVGALWEVHLGQGDVWGTPRCSSGVKICWKSKADIDSFGFSHLRSCKSSYDPLKHRPSLQIPFNTCLELFSKNPEG